MVVPVSRIFNAGGSLVGMAGAAGGSRRQGLTTGALSMTVKVMSNHDGMMRLKGFSDSPKTVLEQIAFAGAQRMAGEIIKAMAEDKSGTWYRHLPNRSSAPGEFPAIQSGDLVNSIRVYVSKSPANSGRANVGIGKGLPRSYAFYLEYGTRYMAPRPIARRAAVQFRAETVEAMGMKWQELRRGQAISAGRSKLSPIYGGSD